MDKKEKNKDSALNVQPGVDRPSSVNPLLSKGMQQFRKGRPDAAMLLEGIRSGDRGMLGRAITLVESSLASDKAVARDVIQGCLPHSGNSIRIGITGVPGVGKSTFIEAFGSYLIGKGMKVAVLAIDPSSQRSKGSILGDKTRMESLAANDSAFIRPSASAGTLGGVARKTRETITLCEAAGFDIILVETVGVGQSETAVAQIVDFFLLLMLAGGGDELQGIKRGIMEMADMIVINKADGDNTKKAELARKEYENALHLFPALENGWIPKVGTVSALYSGNIDNVWETISSFVELTKGNGHFVLNRREQSAAILRESIETSLLDSFFHSQWMKQHMDDVDEKIRNGTLSPYDGADMLLKAYHEGIKPNRT